MCVLDAKEGARPGSGLLSSGDRAQTSGHGINTSKPLRKVSNRASTGSGFYLRLSRVELHETNTAAPLYPLHSPKPILSQDYAGSNGLDGVKTRVHSPCKISLDCMNAALGKSFAWPGKPGLRFSQP